MRLKNHKYCKAMIVAVLCINSTVLNASDILQGSGQWELSENSHSKPIAWVGDCSSSKNKTLSWVWKVDETKSSAAASAAVGDAINALMGPQKIALGEDKPLDSNEVAINDFLVDFDQWNILE